MWSHSIRKRKRQEVPKTFARGRGVYLASEMQSVEKDKLHSGREDGVSAGVREASGELHVLTDNVAVKVRTFNRRRRNKDGVRRSPMQLEVYPWSPYHERIK